MLSLSFVFYFVYQNIKLPHIAERVGNPEHSLLPCFIFCPVCFHFSMFLLLVVSKRYSASDRV